MNNRDPNLSVVKGALSVLQRHHDEYQLPDARQLQRAITIVLGYVESHKELHDDVTRTEGENEELRRQNSELMRQLDEQVPHQNLPPPPTPAPTQPSARPQSPGAQVFGSSVRLGQKPPKRDKPKNGRSWFDKLCDLLWPSDNTPTDTPHDHQEVT